MVIPRIKALLFLPYARLYPALAPIGPHTLQSAAAGLQIEFLSAWGWNCQPMWCRAIQLTGSVLAFKWDTQSSTSRSADPSRHTCRRHVLSMHRMPAFRWITCALRAWQQFSLCSRDGAPQQSLHHLDYRRLADVRTRRAIHTVLCHFCGRRYPRAPGKRRRISSVLMGPQSRA